MEMKKLDGFLLARLLHGGAANLKANKQTVNDLNVFPIPDGDTGDNMFLTINAGATAAGEGSENLSQTAGKAASGMLLGAHIKEETAETSLYIPPSPPHGHTQRKGHVRAGRM